MSGSPPYELFAFQVGTMVSCILIAIINWRTFRRQRAIRDAIEGLNSEIDQLIASFEEQLSHLAGSVAELGGDLAQLQDVRAELRRHATSDLLHPERSDGR